MSQMYVTPKGPKGNFKGGQGGQNQTFHSRTARFGSQTWSHTQQVPFNAGFSNTQPLQYSTMPTQVANTNFYPQTFKPEYMNYAANNIFTNSCSFDSASSESPQGSPRSLSRDGSPQHTFDMLPEDAISTVSSPGDDFHESNSYFTHSREHGSIAGELGSYPTASTAHYPLSMIQTSAIPRSTPPQSPPPIRSRQGSTTYPPLQQSVDYRNGGAPREDPNSPTQRRGPKQSRNQKRNGQQKAEFYMISTANLSEDSSEEEDIEAPEMLTTLSARVQLSICRKVDEVLRSALFWWLVHYQFAIPRNPRARDIETAEDRDYEGFCAVVNELTAKRWVPRDAVHHERIAELNTVLAGPAEIRHMLAHPERHLKSDWRMLGLIAAAIEVCKILQYKKGHRQLYQLYGETDKQIAYLRVQKLDDKDTEAKAGDPKLK